MLQDYEIPSRNFLSFSKSFTDFSRWFPEYQRQDVNVNQVSWITLKKNITKRNVYYTFVTGQLFQIATSLSLGTLRSDNGDGDVGLFYFRLRTAHE